MQANYILPGTHSTRRAAIGSMRAARRAGMDAAARATTVRVAAATAMVSGSAVETPYMLAATMRASAMAAAAPSAAPTANRMRVSRRISQSTEAGLAPMAMRM